MKVMRGPVVDEIHQQFNSWIAQVWCMVPQHLDIFKFNVLLTVCSGF